MFPVAHAGTSLSLPVNVTRCGQFGFILLLSSSDLARLLGIPVLSILPPRLL